MWLSLIHISPVFCSPLLQLTSYITCHHVQMTFILTKRKFIWFYIYLYFLFYLKFFFESRDSKKSTRSQLLEKYVVITDIIPPILEDWLGVRSLLILTRTLSYMMCDILTEAISEKICEDSSDKCQEPDFFQIKVQRLSLIHI